MSNTFPRSFVDTLRKEAGNHRTKNKILVKALLKSECARAGIDCGDIADDVVKHVIVTQDGTVQGIAKAMSIISDK